VRGVGRPRLRGHAATTERGETLRFDRAVLCTGSTALVPPLVNAGAIGVHVFRDPEDCARILEHAAAADRAAVVGGGLLGLEAAYALARLGVATTVVHLMDRLMERQLGDRPARSWTSRTESWCNPVDIVCQRPGLNHSVGAHLTYQKWALRPAESFAIAEVRAALGRP
jgi:hypothetical protein